MPKKLISEEQVIHAANLLANSGKSLTLAAVRIHLGAKGSNATIHKYLKKWKHECFKQSSNQQNSSEPYNNNIEEKRILEQTLHKQLTQNEHYAQELISAEKTNIVLKEKNHQLQIANQELQQKLTTVEITNNALLQTTQEINNRLDANDNKTIQKMQQTIDDLRMELKTLNETSLTALRETSNKGHETLMQEKVTIINLQAKVGRLNNELLESKKQLNEALIVNQVQTRALSKQIEWQQKIIEEYIGDDQLKHQKEDLNLNPSSTSMVETPYGK